MIYYGLSMMVCAGAGLYGVLYQLHHMAMAWFHDRLWADPLASPRSPVERRHLRKTCAECGMIAELVVTRAVSLP